ncbi:TPA: flagellar hook-length control protein FliK, partial [Candidatus Poribacteria bacterium]|nr:flagellar hook-length control protein FliK [Candidatus Poribacteria bacterium]
TIMMKPLSISSDKLSLFLSNRDLNDLKTRLYLGQTIRGRILEVLPQNKVILKLRGFNVVAESEMAFQKGDILAAVVYDLGRKIILRLLPPHAGKLSRSPRDILRYLSMSTDTLNLMIAEELQDLGVPPTKVGLEGIRGAVEAWEILLKSLFDRRQLIRAILFLSLRSVPVTPQSLAIIHQYLYGKPLLGAQLRKLARQLREHPDGERAEDALKGLEKIFSSVEKRDLAGRLSRIVRALGLSYESEVKAGLFGSQGIGSTLKHDLLLLEQGLRTPEEEAFREVLESVTDLLGNLEAQQLASLPRADEASGSFAYFQIPLLWEDEEGTAEVWVFRGRGKRIDPEDVLLALQIHMRHLGEVRVKVGVSHGTLTCRFAVEGEAIRSLFERNFSELTERLVGLNYFVREVGCALMEDEEVFDRFRGPIFGGGESRRYIDIAV